MQYIPEISIPLNMLHTSNAHSHSLPNFFLLEVLLRAFNLFDIEISMHIVSLHLFNLLFHRISKEEGSQWMNLLERDWICYLGWIEELATVFPLFEEFFDEHSCLFSYGWHVCFEHLLSRSFQLFVNFLCVWRSLSIFRL